jgi:alpha-glucosidase
MTLPGVPVVFMGDEIGLTALDGEHARTPYPWHRRQEWDAPTLEAYRSWIALRTGSVALRRGGMRWVHVGADSMTFLREHPDQTVLVHVARGPHAPVRLPAPGLAGVRGLRTLAGADARLADGVLVLPDGGPGAHVYDLDVAR